MVLELQKQEGFHLLTFSSCILTKTCSSIFAFSLVSLVICFRQISAPVRVALPEELQSPLYVGKLGRPVSLQERETIWIDCPKILTTTNTTKCQFIWKKKLKVM